MGRTVSKRKRKNLLDADWADSADFIRSFIIRITCTIRV